MHLCCGIFTWPFRGRTSDSRPLSTADRVKLVLTWVCSFWLACVAFWPTATFSPETSSQWSCYVLVEPLQHIFTNDEDVDDIEWWQLTTSPRPLQTSSTNERASQICHHYLCIRLKDGKGIVIDASVAHSGSKTILFDEDFYLQHCLQGDSDHKRLTVAEAKTAQERGSSNRKNPPVCMSEVADEVLQQWEKEWIKEGKTWETLAYISAKDRTEMFDDLVRRMRVGMIWKMDDVGAEETCDKICRDAVARWLESVE